LKIGMPKSDPLAGDRGPGIALLARLELDPALPTVAYCPTRSATTARRSSSSAPR